MLKANELEIDLGERGADCISSKFRGCFYLFVFLKRRCLPTEYISIILTTDIRLQKIQLFSSLARNLLRQY